MRILSQQEIRERGLSTSTQPVQRDLQKEVEAGRPLGAAGMGWTPPPQKYGPFDSSPVTQETPEEKYKREHPWLYGLKGAAKGVADIALQPARFLERGGKYIGTLGMTDEEKKKVDEYLGPGLQERVGGREYATDTYKDAKQFAGGALQAGANLATPFVGSASGLAAQSAALAGGRALEEGKGAKEALGDAVIGGIVGGAVGKGSNVAGAVIGKGASALRQEAKELLKPLAKKLAPALTGITKGETKIAFEQLPEITARKLKIISSLDNPADAEAVLRRDLLEGTRSVVNSAKNKAENEFGSVVNGLQSKYPEARGDVPGIAIRLKEKLPTFGRVIRDSDQEKAMMTIMDTLQEPREYTLDGMRRLGNDIWSIAEQTDQGTPARRAAMEVWKDVRKEISKMTNGEIDPAMAKYSTFKDNWIEIKPVWSETATEDSARNFVSNLESNAKTASRDSLKYLEDLAGQPGSATNEITIHRLVKKLSKDQKITGNRLSEILIAGGIYSGGGAIGEAIGGEKGKSIGQAAGAILGAKALAPVAISNVLLPEIEKAGVALTSPLRQAIGKAISSPAFQQALLRSLQGDREDETQD